MLLWNCKTMNYMNIDGYFLPVTHYLLFVWFCWYQHIVGWVGTTVSILWDLSSVIIEGSLGVFRGQSLLLLSPEATCFQYFVFKIFTFFPDNGELLSELIHNGWNHVERKTTKRSCSSWCLDLLSWCMLTLLLEMFLVFFPRNMIFVVRKIHYDLKSCFFLDRDKRSWSRTSLTV